MSEKKDKKKKDKKDKKDKKKKSHHHFSERGLKEKGTKNIFGEDRDSQESVKSFGLISKSDLKSKKSSLSMRSLAASDYADSLASSHHLLERRIFKKDATLMFRKMAATIDMGNNPEPDGPVGTLKDQIYSGEILKMMYHRRDIQIDNGQREGQKKFQTNFERICRELVRKEKEEMEERGSQVEAGQSQKSWGGVSLAGSEAPKSIFSGMSSLSKRPSEMNDVEIREQTLSFRDRLKMQSNCARDYIDTLNQYEEKDRKKENDLRNGKGRKPAATLPYAETSEYHRRVENRNKALTDEENFQRRLNAAIKKKKHEAKIKRNFDFIASLEKDNDKVALSMKEKRKEEKRARKREKKARRRLGDESNPSCQNRDIGDNRFAENYKCDWKLRLYDKEKELANKMSKAQFRDDPDSDDVENERDMGEDMRIHEDIVL